MGKIKSAFEIAMEKAQNINVSDAEIEKMEYVAKGRAIGARLLDIGEMDFEDEFAAYPAEYRPYLVEGAQETMLNNILLPENEVVARAGKTAMEGIMKLKTDKQAAGDVMGQIERLFQYYAQALQQAVNEVRNNFEAKRESLMQAMEQQYGGQVQGVEQAAFQEEWLRAKNNLNAQYETYLEEQKEQVRKID